MIESTRTSMGAIQPNPAEEQKKDKVTGTFLDFLDILYVMSSPDRKDWKYPSPAKDLVTMVTSDRIQECFTARVAEATDVKYTEFELDIVKITTYVWLKVKCQVEDNMTNFPDITKDEEEKVWQQKAEDLQAKYKAKGKLWKVLTPLEANTMFDAIRNLPTITLLQLLGQSQALHYIAPETFSGRPIYSGYMPKTLFEDFEHCEEFEVYSKETATSVVAEDNITEISMAEFGWDIERK